jgi:hypothetical protein
VYRGGLFIVWMRRGGQATSYCIAVVACCMDNRWLVRVSFLCLPMSYVNK